ncbi:MAG: efflux RND transporter periplasmic adaptor subunit [Magnetospiraceae bacterium]
MNVHAGTPLHLGDGEKDKTMLRFAILALSIAVASVPTSAQESEQKPAKPTAKPAATAPQGSLVSVDAVVREPLTQTMPVIGRMVARRSGVVAARASGPLETLAVQVGDRVAAGQVLASLALGSLHWNRELHRAQVSQASAAFAAAEDDLALRQQELDRLVQLRQSAAFSQARADDKQREVSRAQADVAEAAASVAAAKANLELAEITIADAEIKAPYAGVVAKRHTSPGAYVNPGSSIVTLIDDSSLEVEADVPSDRLAGLAPGVAVSVLLPGETTPRQSEVRALVPDENPLTRTRAVRFTPQFDPTQLQLAVNQSATVLIPIGEKRDVVSVHKDAILSKPQGFMVYVAEDGVAQLQPVKLGEAVGSRFEVLDGLEPGMLTVVRGNERLQPGSPIMIGNGS